MITWGNIHMESVRNVMCEVSVMFLRDQLKKSLYIMSAIAYV